ncbi:hypothetical protein EJB05_47367, partial [Eragrostis curvula]
MEVSSVFCGNNAEVGSWPAEGIRSTLTNQDTVRALCEKFGIPADYAPSCAGGDGWACKAPPHLKSAAICVYEDALDAGMRLPLHPFYSKLLRHYGLAPSQLTPNAWRYMAAFVVLCSDLGHKPRLSVFRHFFTICICKNKGMDGWHFFKPHKVSEYDRRYRLFSTTTSLPNNDGWKEKFFFLSSPTATWPCPVNWGKLTPEAAGDSKLSTKAQKVIQELYNKKESERPNLLSLLAEHKLAAALALATPLKMEVSSGRIGPTSPNVKSPNVVASTPVSPPAGSMTSDQLLSKPANADGDDWLRTVLNKTADVMIKESSLLRQQLSEARESEAAAKAEVVAARKSEMAIKAELGKARKSEATAKLEVAKRRKSEAAAKARLSEARKSEAAAKAQVIATKAKLEDIIKSEVATKAELMSTKAALQDMKKSAVVAAKAELAAAKAKVKKMGNEYFEDFVRLHNLMMDGIESSFDKVSKSQLGASQPGTDNPEQTQHEKHW